ncbi:hypothetical protein [Cryobacterium sp. W22_MBD10_FK3]
MGIRRRTRRIRHWYRRRQHSKGMLAVRILGVLAAATGVAVLVAVAVRAF